MKVEIIGEGKPKYAVVACIHGDEPCGKTAIERLKQSNYQLKSGVKLILANEKAYQNNERYIDTDLNRVFPGDEESSVYEERIAAKLIDELRGLRVLDLHSTKSTNKIFAATSVLDAETEQLIKDTTAEYTAYFKESNMDVLMDHVNAISVECGYQGSDQAAENAFNVAKNFLAAEGVINEKFEKSDPKVFKIEETVERPEVDFEAENFKQVEEGEVYAENGEEKLKAEESFYPVLMSTDGYEDILGYKAKEFK